MPKVRRWKVPHYDLNCIENSLYYAFKCIENSLYYRTTCIVSYLDRLHCDNGDTKCLLLCRIVVINGNEMNSLVSGVRSRVRYQVSVCSSGATDIYKSDYVKSRSVHDPLPKVLLFFQKTPFIMSKQYKIYLFPTDSKTDVRWR